MEYKLMNREELSNYIYNFWEEFGAFNYDERNDNMIRQEIYDNLGTFKGIEKELDYIRNEFESGWDESSLEYEELDKLWNYINWYKTSFKEEI